MGRKPTEAVPPQQPILRGPEPTQQDVQKKEDEKLLEEVQKEIPVWTPKGEKELEEIERAVEKEVMAQKLQGEGLGIRTEPSTVEESESTIEIKSNTEENRQEENPTHIATSEDSPSTLEPAVVDRVPDDTVTKDGPVGEETKESSELEDDSVPSQPEFLPAQNDTVTILPETTGEKVPEDTKEDDATKSFEEKEPEIISQGLSIPVPEATLVIDPPTPEAIAAAPSVESLPPPPIENETTSSEIRPENAIESLPPPLADSIPPAAPIPDSLPLPTAVPSSPEPPISSHPIITIPPASVPIPPSAPSTPISSPPQRPSSVSSLPEMSSPPPATTGPVRKKTLKERLAEAARRGSTNSSLVNVTSPPPSTRPSLDTPVTREVKEEVVAKEEKKNGIEAASSPTTSNGTVSTDAATLEQSKPPIEVTRETENGQEAEKEKKETIEVEEGSFL